MSIEKGGGVYCSKKVIQGEVEINIIGEGGRGILVKENNTGGGGK